MRVSRGRYLYREPDRPMDVALLQEYLEPVEVYEKRPARRRRVGNQRQDVPESVRMALYAAQRGVCPGCGFHQPHHLRFEVDHIVALSDDGEDETRNLQLLCPYCNRVKGTPGQSRLILVRGKIPGSPSSGSLTLPDNGQLQHQRREFQPVGGFSITFKPQTRPNTINV